ncbi:acyl-CoA thioesterase [Fodinicola feengrottensis]|uniref:acyl-CoA thioesterase n=1 Tax=Fodinicola feengrottensis TaxID=435914 RepID=UPI0024413C20|nr:acyl-CoA thioesterase domain-containing protein [Fodinicola feengrottensis]
MQPDPGPDPSHEFGPLLELEELDDNLFRGWCHSGLPQRVFGGNVAAQALVAAGRTVPAQRPVHSLHGYFVRAGNPDHQILYQVEKRLATAVRSALGGLPRRSTARRFSRCRRPFRCLPRDSTINGKCR